jgi:hypothetical protein
MALPFTHFSVNGPSEKLTGLSIGLHQKVYTLEKEHRCHTPHGLTLQCHRMCMFIGCANYCCDMSPSCEHILKPLRDQSSLITYFMDRQNAKSICKMSLLMAARIACPDHDKWFGIHTNASDFQLGTCIIQEGRLVAFFSCKLTMSQQNYTRLENEFFPS